MRPGEHAGAIEHGDAVFLHQEFDAAAQLLDHTLFARLYLREIETHPLGNEAEIARIFHLAQQIGGGEQRFSGNAAEIQTGAAHKTFLDQRRVQPMLRRLDRRHISPRPPTQDSHIKPSLRHYLLLLLLTTKGTKRHAITACRGQAVKG